MQKINVSINRNIVDKPPAPTARGWENAQMTIDELISHVKSGYAFSPGVLKPDKNDGKKPTAQEIDYAELLVLDIDNDIYYPGQEKRRKTIEEGYVDFNIIKKDDWMKDNLLFAYTTPSHTPEHHKFRLVFKLPQPISDQNKYKEVAKAFISYFNADPSCNNIDRLFYGNRNAEIYAPKKELDANEYQRIIGYRQNSNGQTTQNGTVAQLAQITPDDVAAMLKYIPARMDYFSWFKVVSAIGNHFADDLVTAEKLINEWSPDDERGTRWRLEHRGRNINIGSLIWMAKQYGYSPTKLLSKAKMSEFSVSKDGQLQHKKKSPMKLAEEYLLEHYDFRFDVVKGVVEFKTKDSDCFVQMKDRDVNSLVRELEENDIKVSATSLHNRIDSDFVPTFHPFKEYFYNLPEWDGHDYITEYADIVTVAKEQQQIWRTFFARWIVAAVGCAIEYPRLDGQGQIINHTCLVLVGKQGAGKSTFINRLVPKELENYYAIAQINPNDKDSKQLVAEHFIINLDELESSTRDEMASLKSLITAPHVNIRRAYGRRVEKMPRRASFAGSVNKATFLTDITGERRFLPVEALEINLDKTVNLEQMYAQCLYLLRNPIDDKGTMFKYWFDGDEIDKINEHNAQFAVALPEEELLLKTFAPVPNAYGLTAEQLKALESNGALELLSSTEIYNEIQRQTPARLSMYKMSQLLKKHGFVQTMMKMQNGIVKRPYAVKRVDNNKQHDF